MMSASKTEIVAQHNPYNDTWDIGWLSDGEFTPGFCGYATKAAAEADIPNFDIAESPDYDLPFEVRGFFSVTGCEFDETLPGARRMQRGVLLGDDGEGGIDVQPWFLDDPPKRQ